MSDRETHGSAGGPPREEGADVDRLLAELPRSLPPDRDLLPGVRARIAAERGTSGRDRSPGSGSPRRFAPLRWLAAAAVLLVALGAGVWALSGPGPEPAARVAGSGNTGSDARTVEAPAAADAWSRVEGRYTEAVGDLLEELAQGASALSAERRAAIRRNLAVIDRALAEIREAVADDPDDPALLRGAERTWQWKLDYLRQAAQATARSQA